MSEAKRYDLVGDMDGNCNLNEARMELSDDGVYVKHRDYEALQDKCAALVTENALIKSAIPEPLDIDVGNDNMDDVSLSEDLGFNYAIELIRRRIPETPATDAFLNEVRAQGGAKALEDFAEFNIKSIDPFDDEYTEVLKETARAARCFAAQLRKGGEQK